MIIVPDEVTKEQSQYIRDLLTGELVNGSIALEPTGVAVIQFPPAIVNPGFEPDEDGNPLTG